MNMARNIKWTERWVAGSFSLLLVEILCSFLWQRENFINYAKIFCCWISWCFAVIRSPPTSFCHSTVVCCCFFYVEKWFPSFHVADINCTVSTVVLHNTKRTSLIKKFVLFAESPGRFSTRSRPSLWLIIFLHSHIPHFLIPPWCAQMNHPILFFFTFLSHITKITNLKPAASYVFIVRAENSYGVSMPSPMSSAITTSDNSDKNNVPHGELVAARTFLSGKVSRNCKIASSSTVDAVVAAAARLV